MISSSAHTGVVLAPSSVLNPQWKPNKGLIQRFIALPGRTGGKTWYDLASAGYGTLSNWTDPVYVGFQRSDRGRRALLRFDDCTSIPRTLTLTNAATASNSEYTMGCWCRVVSSSATGGVLLKTGTSQLLQLATSGGQFYFKTWFPSTGGNFSTLRDYGVWYRVILVRRGTTIYFYVNGKADGSYSNTTTAVSIVTVGQYTGSTGNRYVGDLDDIVFATRPWSDSEIFADYIDGTQGYKQALRSLDLGLLQDYVAASSYFPWGRRPSGLLTQGL